MRALLSVTFPAVVLVYATCICGQTESSSSKPQPSKSQPVKTEQTKTATRKSETGKTETTTSESKHRQTKNEKEHGHGHSHVGGGVSMNVDLGGIGQRKPEPDPFAGGGRQPVSHPEEKSKTSKKPHGTAPTDPFRDVQLTGEQAKAENKP